MYEKREMMDARVIVSVCSSHVLRCICQVYTPSDSVPAANNSQYISPRREKSKVVLLVASAI